MPGSAPTVLVVDDEPGVRDALRSALELEGFQVSTAPDGLCAVRRVWSGGVDAVVLDVAMPVVDGLEACRRVRAAGSQVPILMLTARDAVDDRVAGLEAGADDYLPKPFALRELVARLRAIMRRSTGPGRKGDGDGVLRFAERAARHALSQRFDVDLEETTVVGSPPRLTRAVNNLLDNAVRFNAPGAPVEVRLRDGELEVRDHGPGFDTADLPHVFDRFFRGAHARERAGSGLGLAIARQAATSHGGGVTAGNAEDGGARVRLRLPVAEREPAPSP